MAQSSMAFVTRVLPTGPAFALRVDNDEHIYIPKGVSQRLELQEMDHIDTILIRNTVEPERTPWFCISAIIQHDQVEEV